MMIVGDEDQVRFGGTDAKIPGVNVDGCLAVNPEAVMAQPMDVLYHFFHLRCKCGHRTDGYIRKAYK